MKEAHDAKVDTLEQEIRGMNEVLHGMGDRLKLLVAGLPSNNNTVSQNVSTPAHAPAPPTPAPAMVAVTTQPAHATGTVHPHPPQAVASTSVPAQQHATLPPPNVLVREENSDGQLDRMVSREEYKGPTNIGKHNYCELGMAKPYMFIYREGLQMPKQKLEIRASLSMIEYVNCTLLLIQDPEAFNQEDLPHMLSHLAAVMTDAMVWPWQAVRSWSQYIWDCVEKGKCTWKSFQFIQDERVRMSFISGAPSGNSCANTSSHKPVSNDLRVVLCRE